MFSGKIIWSYSEAAIDPSSYKGITFYFLTTTFRSYFWVKLQVWIIYVDTWRRFNDGTTSTRLHMDFVSTLKRLCLSKVMQLYKRINSIKSIFLVFLNSYHVEKVLENTYFVFYILYNPFQNLLLVDTTNKKVYWKFGILVPEFCNVRLDEAKSENETFLVIMTIDLIWNTFLSHMCI